MQVPNASTVSSGTMSLNILLIFTRIKKVGGLYNMLISANLQMINAMSTA